MTTSKHVASIEYSLPTDVLGYQRIDFVLPFHLNRKYNDDRTWEWVVVLLTELHVDLTELFWEYPSWRADDFLCTPCGQEQNTVFLNSSKILTVMNRVWQAAIASMLCSHHVQISDWNNASDKRTRTPTSSYVCGCSIFPSISLIYNWFWVLSWG